jgi:hypothetical protein
MQCDSNWAGGAACPTSRPRLRKIRSRAKKGHAVTPELIACTRPDMHKHILGFSKYGPEMDGLPDPRDPQPLPLKGVIHAL